MSFWQFLYHNAWIFLAVAAIYELCMYFLGKLSNPLKLNLKKWQFLLRATALCALFIFCFFKYGRTIINGTLGIGTTMFDAMLGFAFLALIGNVAKHYWHKFNRCSIIDQSRETTQYHLLKLPEEYAIYNDVCIGQAKIDHVVVGSNGVFIIKNMSVRGVVHCSKFADKWMVEKTGRNGGEYTSQIFNPVRQVNWQIGVLKKYFVQHGCNIWIEGLVSFNNGDGAVLNKLENCMTSNTELIGYISNYEPQKPIDKKTIDNINKLLINPSLKY